MKEATTNQRSPVAALLAFTAILLAVLLLLVAGCTPAAVKDSVRENSARCDKFVELMDEEKTTRDQEQRFIKANQKAWKALAERWE